MEGISSARIAEVKAPDVNREERIQHTVIKDLEPDSFESSKKAKPNIAEITVAGGTALGVYKGSKTVINKGLDWVAKESGGFIKEWGEKTAEQAVHLPGKFKAVAIYGGAAAAALGAFVIALRDKDGDGQLDIIEGFKKMVKPD